VSQTPACQGRQYVDQRNHSGELASAEGALMKKALVLFFLLAVFRVFSAVHVSAQEKSYITVRGSDLNNGVVILDILKANKACQLQCNQGAPGCTALKNGNYQIVQLPQNFGM
jgi:hypothetical protein